VWLKPSGIACFAGDLPGQEQKLVWATQGVPDADLFNQKLEGTAWRSKPSWYIVGKNDRTVHPDLQRFVAKRMGATIYEVDSSHVPMLSNPKLVIDEIWTEDGVFYDPKTGVHRGRDAIDHIAGAIRATHPDFQYQPIAKPEELGNAGRVQWVSGRPGEAPAYAGTDFIIARDGRIAALYLFFDKLP
jgi:hypothetical protein